uniref:Uncharacterized protein n=1 Tax=Quercus lobata TaxID=97700 RepID=A0A7N2L752_QUELO
MFYHYLMEHQVFYKSEYYKGCDKEFPLFDEGFTGPRLCKPCSIQYGKLDFEEFCAAAISLLQLEEMESWEQHARHAYELFEMDVNKPIMFKGTCLCILVSFKRQILIQFFRYLNRLECLTC